jgi:putative AdoMet-dependent methyltransferase
MESIFEKRKKMNKELNGKWNFDKWAAHYDKSITKGDWMFKDYNFILEKIVQYAAISHPNLTLLDIGIGTGNLASRFLEYGIKVIGVDPSNEMRKTASRKYPQICLYKGHFLDLPFMNQSIDIIVSSFAFHHLPYEKKENAILEMKRVLKSMGKIIIADLMFKNKANEKAIKEKLIQNGKTKMIAEIEDEYYSRFEDLRKKFETHGFSFSGEQLTDFVWILCATLKS